jgi:hypothetical protein
MQTCIGFTGFMRPTVRSATSAAPQGRSDCVVIGTLALRIAAEPHRSPFGFVSWNHTGRDRESSESHPREPRKNAPRSNAHGSRFSSNAVTNC